MEISAHKIQKRCFVSCSDKRINKGLCDCHNKTLTITSEKKQPKKPKTMTKGNIIVEDIKIGDVHYEFEYGVGIKSEVISLPVRSENGYWTWQSKNVRTSKIIEYGVREGMSHYAPNIYDYEAYKVKSWI